MNEFTLEELQKEIWKDVPGYEGLYQVSDLGRVKSLSYNRTNKERILKYSIDRGYKQVKFYKNLKKKTFKIHILVIKAFKPEEYKKCIELPGEWVIDHKIEGNKTDNSLSNLQVITHIENVQKSVNKSKTSSQYFGVCFNKISNKWKAEICINGKQKKLGSFTTELEAYEARQKAEEMAKNGDFSFMNPKEYSSKYRGVYFDKASQKWRAYIKINGKQKELGRFPTELQAYKAVQKAEESAKNGDLSFMKFREKTSKYKGVSFHKQKNKWTAYITINGQTKSLGYFPTELEAHEAVQKALENLN